MTEFAHLYVHSDHSISHSSASIPELVTKASSLGMKHLALTDRGNMFGIPDFVKTCRRKNIHPVIGCDFLITSYSVFNKETYVKPRNYQIVLLASNEEGYKNLMKLSSSSYSGGYSDKPGINDELLDTYSQGLIGFSNCTEEHMPDFSPVPYEQTAKHMALHFQQILGKDNFFIELQGNTAFSQTEKNAWLVNISKETGIPLVVTNDIRYTEKSDASAHDVLVCIAQRKYIDDQDRIRLDNDEYYFKTPDEMACLFPEYPDAVANTVKIAERCNFVLNDKKPELPIFDIPNEFASSTEYLRCLALDGMKQRFDVVTAPQKERLEYELEIIGKVDCADYFLIVADIVDWARKNGIPVGPGRGTVSSSIVAYALNITNIDPLKYGLLFECFINPECISIPAFEIDVAKDGRREVIQYVIGKYGANCVGQIISFIIYGVRSAINNVARVLNISSDEIEKIIKLIPFNPRLTLQEAFEEEPRLRELKNDPRYAELFLLAGKFEGKIYDANVHHSGIVISKINLQDCIPLCRSRYTDLFVSQYNDNEIANHGLFTLNISDLRELDEINQTEKLIHKKGSHFSGFTVYDISLQDKNTFDLFCEGNTKDIFLFKSDGMQKILKQSQPDCFMDLVNLYALYRPERLDSIPLYIDRKKGKQPIQYPHPCMESILKETYGIIIYKEHINLIICEIASYSAEQADSLRRELMKRETQDIESKRDDFCLRAKLEREEASRIFDILAHEAQQAFLKGYAIAFVHLAYQTAYLRANFPDECMTAIAGLYEMQSTIR